MITKKEHPEVSEWVRHGKLKLHAWAEVIEDKAMKSYMG